jgi:hypothetical protein
VRNRWDHEAPEDHQERPRDNTSRYIYAQVSRWLRTDEPIHPEVAMEIAAWWHGPSPRDTAVTAFSHTGDVKIHGVDGWDDGAGLGPDLVTAVRVVHHREVGHRATELSLAALVSYVTEVTEHATRYRRSIWHGGGHRWMSTGTVDEDSCLTCGVHATLRPERESDGDYGCYYGGDGELIIACTGRTDLVHGYERACEADSGRGCGDGQLTGICKHTDHVCNCLLCN